MKPQCTTAAQCLKELARVMEQFGIDDPVTAISSMYIKRTSNIRWVEPRLPQFEIPETWQFALAEVEGNAVFKDSVIYDETGKRHIAGEILTTCWNLFSLNPPKPKTVMVEMLRDDAERLLNCEYKVPIAIERAKDAITKALKECE